MRRWTVQYECWDGGHGWGEKGDQVSIGGFKAEVIDFVISQANRYMPQGWHIISIKEAQA